MTRRAFDVWITADDNVERKKKHTALYITLTTRIRNKLIVRQLSRFETKANIN